MRRCWQIEWIGGRTGHALSVQEEILSHKGEKWREIIRSVGARLARPLMPQSPMVSGVGATRQVALLHFTRQLIQFQQHAAGRARVDEGVQNAVFTGARRFVDELDAFGLQPVQGRRDVIDL